MNNAVLITPCSSSDTLLWPLSCTGFSKWFPCLTGKESLFQQAALSLTNLGWIFEITLRSMCSGMVANDLERAKIHAMQTSMATK